MEKAIDIKRRAQRCIQNGDLDGALNEYEKLVDSEESDPYNYVLLADLLYKKGDQGAASERYLSAVGAYERASLFKNAIAVCKKMLRLSLSPARVLQSLGNLHALDGLSGEAALYYVQYAEHMVRSSAPVDAANALRQAFDVCQDNIRVLEQLSEAWLLAGENGKASEVLVEAAAHYRSRGAEADARRCGERAVHLDPGHGAKPGAAAIDDLAPFAAAAVPAPEVESGPRSTGMRDPRAVHLPAEGSEQEAREEALSPAPPLDLERMHGLESGRHDIPRPEQAEASAEPAAATPDRPQVLGDDDALAPQADGGDDDPVALHDDGGELDAHDDEPVTLEHEDGDEDEDAGVEYVIEDETPVAGDEPGAEDVVARIPEDEPVYEIDEDEVIPFETMVAQAVADEPVQDAADEPVASSGDTPEAPGFAHAPSARMDDPEPTPEEIALAEVEMLLASAQEQFRAGERDGASHTLVRAAQAYETLERFENAATIYRSLGKGAHATPEILERWLGNCERRNDTHEAAAVACDLGDRALNDGDENGARGWFERAMALDGDSEIARRRLERLAQASERASAAVAVATAETAESAEAAPEANATEPAQQGQRVEIAVGRAEAVSFDLAGLLAEFQRGVEAQLAGDAQSHYDLAMTYREMGLLDQAMDSFRHAEQDTRFAARAAEMAARCLAEQGRHGEAALEFGRALAMPGVTDQNDIELRYYFGNSLVELGRLGEAMSEYELVMERMPEFEDVSDRLDALRRTLDAA